MNSTAEINTAEGTWARFPRVENFASSFLRFLQSSLAIIVLLLLWELCPRLGLVDPLILPPFSEIIWHGWILLSSGKLLPHIVVSAERALGGFFLAAVTGVPLGILFGWYASAGRYLGPLLRFLRQFNSISLLPVFILFFGVGYFTKVVVIYWVVVWPILLSTASGIRYVDPTLVKYGRALALSDSQIFWKIVIPSAVPSIFSGLRMASTYSFLMLVASEEVGAGSGLGFLVFNAQYLMGIHILYVALLTIALLGFATNYALSLLERRLTAWRPDPRTRLR